MGKRILFSYFFISLLIFSACKTDPHAESVDTGFARVKGKTMGTTYSVTYQDAERNNYKTEIDSILVAINQEVSTYIDNSDISLFNILQAKVTQIHTYEKPHFYKNLIAAKEIYEQTNGSFDPTVMPLVNYWGFGYTEKRTINKADEIKIKEILENVGFDKLELSKIETLFKIEKQNPKVQLDFSAIAKGYAVDVIGAFLVSKNIKNYLVEIGGETLCKGKSPRGDVWAVGINVPSTTAKTTDVKQIVKFTDKALATSGNYRNYHTAADGSIYAHTINPKTGFPEKSNLLSATVIADDCITADAYATAFMVMGKNAAIELAEKLKNIEIYLIFGEEKGEMNTYQSEGFNQFLTNVE